MLIGVPLHQRARLDDKTLRAYAEEAARLRELAANVTTARLKARLLEEALNQERLMNEAKRGTLQPTQPRSPAHA
jgi:hypothetical protein